MISTIIILLLWCKMRLAQHKRFRLWLNQEVKLHDKKTLKLISSQRQDSNGSDQRISFLLCKIISNILLVSILVFLSFPAKFLYFLWYVHLWNAAFPAAVCIRRTLRLAQILYISYNTKRDTNMVEYWIHYRNLNEDVF